MYGVKYKVPFKTLSDRDSVVTLEERGYTGSVIELIAGGTPITISTDQSDLLTPIRSSTATLAVVGSEYLQDLYTNDPQGIRVKCEVGGEVKWLGYLLPDTFSQDFTHPEFIYEMECVSALSTLKYREFDLTDGFVTFRQIIEKAVEYSGYEAIYLTNSVMAETGKFYDLKISSANFFDELGEASTYYEALEEIAKYLGCCFVPHEDDLYLLDYQAIRSGYNSYTRIVGGSVSNVTLQDPKEVKNYKGTGTKLSRIAGKNKATVNCSLYEIDNLLPEFDDKFTKLVEAPPPYTGNVNGVPHERIIRSYSRDKFLFYKYNNIILGDYADDSPVVLGDVIIVGTEYGAGLVKTAYYATDNKPNRLNMETELFARRFSSFVDGVIPNDAKLFKMTSNQHFLVHPNIHFCINLKTRTLDKLNPYTADGKVGSTVYESEKFKEDGAYQIKLTFKIGEYYYNGDGWQKAETTFPVNIPYKKDTQILDIYREVENNNEYEAGLGELNGYIFKAPDFIISGECELTIHSYRISTRVSAQYLFFKDISLTYDVPDEDSIYSDWSDVSNDVIYENVIDDGYIEPADEIDLKICTNTDGKIMLSSVIDGDKFLKEITSEVFGTDIAENILLKRVIELYKNPRFVIDPVLENNAKPYTVFTEPHLGKEFMNAGGEEDVRMESTRYNLIEM